MDGTTLSAAVMSVGTDYWLWVDAPAGKGSPIASSGKWIVFVPVSVVDRYWQIVSEAVKQGRLGPSAKCATERRSPHEADPTRRPILVYTRDWQDKSDVSRVLAELRTLGIQWRITYKTDAATSAGLYGPNASVYVSRSGSIEFEDGTRRRSPIRSSRSRREGGRASANQC
jgi:hypothetical protein